MGIKTPVDQKSSEFRRQNLTDGIDGIDGHPARNIMMGYHGIYPAW